jgi:hypothetical protein
MDYTSNLRALYLSNLENSNEKILHVVLLDKNNLQNMFELFDKNYLYRSKIELKPIKFYSVTKIINSKLPIKLYGKNNDLLIIKMSRFTKELYENKIFGFTRIINNKLEEAIVYIDHDSDYESQEYKENLDYIKKNQDFGNLSENPIKFDTFYTKGIMNC